MREGRGTTQAGWDYSLEGVLVAPHDALLPERRGVAASVAQRLLCLNQRRLRRLRLRRRRRLRRERPEGRGYRRRVRRVGALCPRREVKGRRRVLERGLELLEGLEGVSAGRGAVCMWGYAPTLIEDVGFLLCQARCCVRVSVRGALRRARSRCEESILLRWRFYCGGG